MPQNKWQITVVAASRLCHRTIVTELKFDSYSNLENILPDYRKKMWVADNEM